MSIFMFNVSAHCGKHTLSFRDGGCATSTNIEIPNVQSCWNYCVSRGSYNMLWKSDKVYKCNCDEKNVDINECGNGDYQYYNMNPSDCNPGNTL